MSINENLQKLVDTMVETIASPSATEDDKRTSSKKLMLFLNEHEKEIDLSTFPEKEMRDGQLCSSRVRLIVGRLLNTEAGRERIAKTVSET